MSTSVGFNMLQIRMHFCITNTDSGMAMLLAAGLVLTFAPREKIADVGPKVDIESLIPKQFWQCRVDKTLPGRLWQAPINDVFAILAIIA